MKKLFILLFYVAAVAFGVFVFLAHREIYNALIHFHFSSGDDIKSFAIAILNVLADALLYISLLIHLIGFIVHLGNNAKLSKGMIKCARRVGIYFVSTMFWSFIGALISQVGSGNLLDFLKTEVVKPTFYIPLALMVLATIVARVMSKGGPISGILVVIGMGVLIGMNIAYYLDTYTVTFNPITIYTIRYVLCIGACALACIPGFIPTIGRTTRDDK